MKENTCLNNLILMEVMCLFVTESLTTDITIPIFIYVIQSVIID